MIVNSLRLLTTFRVAGMTTAQDTAKPTAEMQALLDNVGALDAKPFSTLSVPKARTRPTLRRLPDQHGLAWLYGSEAAGPARHYHFQVLALDVETIAFDSG
ncbi:hypothetical protein OIU34_39020 [Pararhizobium sp. BT-229]|uniref:hypothetical protein n=1 Tax=Pararhizobium sp. BT-229 TaxID=2986923 RepID=UPI0021F6F8B7|nr:hypothetical protein [Pararhizobium sp. BT-229]MCV9967803.1 hypothetical protein [Pararhizobium sp. BT-229]